MLINNHHQFTDRVFEYHGTPQQQQQQQERQSTSSTTMLCSSGSNPANTVSGNLPLLGHPVAAASLLPSPTTWAIPSCTIPGYYNGVNPHYPGLCLVNRHPPIFAVNNFLTPDQCDFLIQAAHDSFGPAPVVGKGAGEVSPSRTSSTCYLAREDLPDLLRKVSALIGVALDQCELPQVGRYLPSQQYLQHCDAFDLSTEDGRRFAANGGQRIVTVLIYLNDVAMGGATRFPLLDMQFQPRRGACLVFFPATLDGTLDPLALHAALPAVDAKYVSQVWIRQSSYQGVPSKRLPQTLGPPLTPAEAEQSRHNRAAWEQATAAVATMVAATTPAPGAGPGSSVATTAAWLLQQMQQPPQAPQLPHPTLSQHSGQHKLPPSTGTGFW